MRIIIAGSRNGVNPSLIYKVLDNIVEQYPNATIITGGASGVDSTANRYAEELGLSTEVYEADWNKFGKSAGPIRNKQMLDSGADLVICIYKGVKTIGTANMAQIAKAAGVEVREFGLKEE